MLCSSISPLPRLQTWPGRRTLAFAVSATDPAEQHVHDAYGRLAADDPHLVAVDILGLDPQQVHQVVLRALADHVPKLTSAEHSSLMQ